MLKLGIHMDNEFLYRGIENLLLALILPFICPFFCLIKGYCTVFQHALELLEQTGIYLTY